MIPSTNECTDAEYCWGRNQRWFLICIAIFVMLSSFAYGFVKGSRESAFAASPLAHVGAFPSSRATSPLLRRLLPAGSQSQSMGSNVKINGQSAEMISFLADHDFEWFVAESQARMGSLGFEATERTSDRRSVSLGINKETGQKITMVVWIVPESVRDAISQGFGLQGTLTVLEPGEEDSSLPGMPKMFDSIQGAVVESTDLGYRTYTTTYANPGRVPESLQFYQEQLTQSGWRLAASTLDVVQTPSLEFKRGVQELTLLFAETPLPLASQGVMDNRSMVTVVLKELATADRQLLDYRRASQP